MNPAADGLRRTTADLLRVLARWRGALAGLLAAAAVATALPLLLPAPPPGGQVLVAARDLAAGAPLAEGDVVPGRLPEGVVPDGALPPGEPLVGRLLAGPVRRGEALTDVRLLGPGLLSAVAPDGQLVAVPVRLADATTAALLRPGDRVDVLAASTAPEAPPAAAVVAAAAPVLAVPAQGPDLDGALVVLATTSPAAARLAAAAVSSRLSAVVVG